MVLERLILVGRAVEFYWSDIIARTA